SPKLTPELQAQVDLDSINFVSNDRLQETLARTTATPAQVTEALRVNAQSRLRALKIALLLMAGVSLLAIFPAGSLPNYQPSEAPSPSPGGRRKDQK
ncbi:MAG: MFS transporter, partial [Deltaproteobacteria bacterium]|nr:MFS transporter [Deltaproteobacteria bacterium]